MKRGTKRLYIGSERYIEGFYGPDRDDEACPHPATCLPDEDWRWALRRTETNWVILEKMKTRNNEPLYEYANVRHLYSHLKTPLRLFF